ncbi:MAG: hypothetical protein HRU41_16360 [Saprospiraceae bacterium]|nr:hypothetical protein [Saprospiraceae bacterium]
MTSNIEKAVVIIASLSLLLGLSIGRIHQQQQEIKQLKASHSSLATDQIRIMIDSDKVIELSNMNDALERVEYKLKEKEEKLRHFRCRISRRAE